MIVVELGAGRLRIGRLGWFAAIVSKEESSPRVREIGVQSDYGSEELPSVQVYVLEFGVHVAVALIILEYRLEVLGDERGGLQDSFKAH